MEATNHLERVLSDTTVRVLAGEKYYQRGLDYFQRRRVKRLERFGDSLEAVVAGTENYRVVLSATAKDFEYRCDCPLGEDGAFCKHCVATALAWLQGEAKTVPVAGTKAHGSAAQVTDEDVVRALELEEKATLIRWLLEWSEQEEGLRRRLMLLAAGRKGTAVLAAQVRRSLEQAIRIRGHIDYDEMPAYAAGVRAAFVGVEALLQQGEADGVMDLCEAGTRWLGSAIERMDDSDGNVSELMGGLEELHLRACEQAQPDAEALAAKLLSLELRGDYGEWSNTPERYAEVLGAKGLAAFREHAGREWAKVRVRTQPGGFGSGEANRYRLTAIMESLARQSGDVEELVAVLERDLSSAHSYERIAMAYREAGKQDKALSWAERGASAHPGDVGADLRVFVAEEYQRNERHAEALRIVWLEFRDRPGLAGYKLLQRFAQAAEDWEDWREQALTHVRGKIASPAKAKRADGAMVSSWRNRKQDHSLLVEIFLYECNIESAWREAKDGGCADSLWRTLAGEREKQHPADAVPIYLRLGEKAIVEASSSRYQPAIDLFERAATLMRSLGRSEEFERELDALRQRYKAKRSLQKLAEERRKFLYRA
jgi:uncharacterized Zn finger protein